MNSSGSSHPIPSAGRLQRLDRIVEILELAASAPDGVPLMDIVAGLGIPAATAHRLLTEMRRLGLLDAASGRDRHRLGERIRALGMLETENHRLYSKIEMVLASLADELVETVFLVRMRSRVIGLVGFSQPSMSVGLHPGYAFPIHASASGKALWAYQSAPHLDAELERPRTKFQAKTLYDEATIRTELANVRQRGYGIHDEEWDEDVYTLAMPIFLGQDIPKLALGVIGLKARIQSHFTEQEIAEKLQRVAAQITPLIQQHLENS